MKPRLALVGGRGYAGAELLGLLARHPGLELAFACSSSQAGQALRTVCPDWPDPGAMFQSMQVDELNQHPAEAWVLAVPNGAARGWAEAIFAAHPESVIVDLSADHRFADDWVYGLPELNRPQLVGAQRIANPGCYATAGMLALWPLRDLLQGPPSLFGVSGYSGAGRTPSPRNDPETLRDNIVPYSLAGHMHEREVSHHLGTDVRFMPHVAAFFRGISMTVSATLQHPTSASELLERYQVQYAGEPRLHIGPDIPLPRQAAHSPDAWLGGFAVDARDARRVTLVSVLDNLGKGAASQAMQNLNLALGLDEQAGLEND